MKLIREIRSSRFYIRLSHWEFWPSHLVYLAIYPIWIWYSIKARSIFFFGASNPKIKNGGFMMESKKDISEIISAEYQPLTLSFKAKTSITYLIATIRSHDLQYPLIIKPDIGMQGKAVIKVSDDFELRSAARQFTVDFIVQPFINYPKEIGIFYVRYPNEKRGKITGIVEKEFLTVRGDGISTIEQLLNLNPRYLLQLPILRQSIGEEIQKVLNPNEEQVLVPYGNHARGALFLDMTHKNNAQLEELMDTICKSIDGFYYGRLDIRYSSFEDLLQNKNWCIIELNGAGSEPTHIYDPKHSLFFAWKEIIRHWKMLYIVSTQNKREGFSYLTFKQGIDMFKANRSHVNQLNEIHFGKAVNTEHREMIRLNPKFTALQ